MSHDADALVAEIPSLRRYGRSLTGSRAAADDLVQDTLERAIQKFHLFEPGTKLRLWLFIFQLLAALPARFGSQRGS